MNTLKRHYLNITAPDGASLNLSWQTCRRRYLKSCGAVCRCCGYRKKIEVHHMIPRHIDPTLTLIEGNLIALCKHCHFHIGHMNNYKDYNLTVERASNSVYNISVRSEHDNK